MLAVNGFRPIQKNYTNQNPNKSNLRQLNFQSKVDSVELTSIVSEATKEADAQVAELTQRYLEKYSDIFGPKFKEVFTEPVNEFLNQHGISIKHTPLDHLKIIPHISCLNSGEVRNASRAELVDETGLSICPVNGSVSSVTANAASARIFNKLVYSEMYIYGRTNPFKGKKFPEGLVAISNKVNDALNDFHSEWKRIRYDNDDLKAQGLQKAFLELMPEK